MAHRQTGRAAGLCFGLASAPAALACAFHGYIPDPTVVDHLLDTEQVVVARLDVSRPGQYQLIEALMGPLTPDLSLTATPTAKERLSADPKATVLLARDGAYGGWRELAVMDARYRGVIDQVMARQSAWQLGEEATRLALFASHLNDPNPDLRRLALRELDRVSYQSLKVVALPSMPTLAQDLNSNETDLAPIRVLLAGLSQDSKFTPPLQAGLEEAVTQNLPYMGAYATALIELEKERGVEHVLERYLRDPDLSLPARFKLMEALSVQHQTASGQTRRAILSGVRALLKSDPTMADVVEAQFGLRSPWSGGGSAFGATGNVRKQTDPER